MERSPTSDDRPTKVRDDRPVVWWVVALITLSLVIANLRVVVGILSVVAIVALTVLLLFVIVLIRKATRPVARLSVLDVALAAWAYRWWERRRTRSRTGQDWRDQPMGRRHD